MKDSLIRLLSPGQIVALSFALVIFGGTTLLMLPIATRTGESMPFVDALLTATSATCVTGLVVVDTGSYFSTFGQLVILACIQIGGLGLMTFTTVFTVLAGKRLAIADRIAIQESFHHTPTGKPRTLIGYIFVGTFLVEAAGAALLTAHWWRTGRHPGFGEALYHGVFHSVSAFCNAGFALYPDNAMSFQRDPFTLSVLMGLIVVGGIGFLVGLDVKEYVQQRLFRRYWSGGARARVEAIRPRPRLSLHTKFVLITTALLLVVGTVSYYLLERRALFAELGEGDAWLNALFCSVTARTAGFNSIDYAAMGGAALLCTMVLMFIGASPGSTGGGIKTSTFGLLIAYSISRWRGHSRLHAFDRTVPQESIDRAASVVVAATALVILGASFLAGVETYGTAPEQSQDEILSIVFETVSAFATVGLSMGETPNLTPGGKLVVCVLMFVGRTGPLTLALAISFRKKRARYQYAEENLMVG